MSRMHRDEHRTADRQAPLGQGGRFAALKGTLSRRSRVTNPGALAAYICRKKYGTKKFAQLSAAGRKGD